MAVVIFSVITAVLAVMTIILSKSNISNYGFLAVLAVFVLRIAAIHLKKAVLISADFHNAAETLKNGTPWEEVTFSVPELQDSYNNYCKELQRIQMETDSVITCDIEDYITISSVNQQIHKGICEAVPGFSTGIGILGTFLGLMLGLRNFNLGTDYETVQESIMVLINGIKTAFLTSIYGVIYSIVFNLVYRSFYHEMINAMETFCEVFHIYAVADAQNEMNRAVVQSQEKQNEIIRAGMEEFMKKVTEHEQKQMKLLCDSIQDFADFSVESSRKQIAALTAGIEKFQTDSDKTQQRQTEVLTDSMNQFLHRSSDLQQKQLELLTDGMESFQKNADKTQQNQTEILTRGIETLRHTLNDFCTTEQKHFQQVHKTVESIFERETVFAENTRQMSEFNALLNQYMNSMQAYQNQIAGSHEKMISQSDKLIQRAEQSIQINQESLNAADRLEQAMETFTSQMNQRLDLLKEKTIQLEKTGQAQTAQMQKTCEEALDTVKQISLETSDMISEMKETQQKTHQQFESLSSSQKEYLKTLRNDTDHTREVISQVSVTIQKATEQMQQTEIFSGALQKYMHQIYAYQEQIAASHEKITSQCDILTERAGKSTELNQESLTITSALQKALTAFTEQMNQQLSALQAQNQEYAVQHDAIYDKTMHLLAAETRTANAAVKEMQNLQEKQKEYLQNLYHDNTRAADALQNVSDSVQKSSAEMYHNYTELSRKLEKGLSSSLTEFDEVTASVASKFVTLLNQIEEQSDQIPKAHQKNYEEQMKLLGDWQKLLDRMQMISAQLKEAGKGASSDETLPKTNQRK